MVETNPLKPQIIPKNQEPNLPNPASRYVTWSGFKPLLKLRTKRFHLVLIHRDSYLF